MKKVVLSCFIFLSLTLLLSCRNESTLQEGKTETTSSILVSNLEQEASCVYLTQNLNNIPVISWVEVDTISQEKFFYFALWKEKEQEFGVQKSIPIPKNTSIHEEGMPKVAFKGDGSMIALFETSTPAQGSRWGIGDILIIQSYDKGKTWSNPTSIYPQKPKNTSISFSGITRLANGEIGISCLGTNQDTSYLGRPILFIKTKNKGFKNPVIVHPEACECCRTDISSSANGRISIAYRNLQQGSVRDISVSTSIDGGMLFHYKEDISKLPWIINGCPHNGPSIITKHNKNFVAWSTGGQNAGVHYAKLTSSGKSLQRKNISKEGRFIQLCLLPNNTRITVYNELYDQKGSVFSRIKINKITDTSFLEMTVTKDSVYASYPVVAPIDNTNVIVAWSTANHAIYHRKINRNKINQKAKEYKYPASTTKHSSPAPLVTDIVCHMQLNPDKTLDSLQFKEITYYFCSDHCKKSFLKTPERYVTP